MVPRQARERLPGEVIRDRSNMAKYREASMEGRPRTRSCMAYEVSRTSRLFSPFTTQYFRDSDGADVDSFTVDMKPVNLQKIQEWVQQGRIDPSRPITVKELRESRCVTNIKDGVKLLAKGSEQLEVPLNVVISRASTKAIAAIEAAGGSVTTRYYTRFAIQRIMRGKMNPIHSLQSQIFVGQELASKSFQNRLPDPTGRKDIEYYRDPAHRGYLSHLVPEGHGPSLFFKTPGTAGAVTKKIIGARKGGSADRLW